jgi:DivIVA domain-containing protein
VFWLQVIAALGVVFATVLVATGRGDSLGDLPVGPRPRLPEDRAIERADVVDLRLGVAFRGYRMDEVDDALDRLADEIASRDVEIAELRRQLAGAPALDSPVRAGSTAVPDQPEDGVGPGLSIRG